jgi:hypothetical protein
VWRTVEKEGHIDWNHQAAPLCIRHLKIFEEHHSPGNAFILGAILPFEQDRAGAAGADQSAMCRLDEMFVFQTNFLAAHVAAFDSGSLARELTQSCKGLVFLGWERWRHVSRRPAELSLRREPPRAVRLAAEPPTRIQKPSTMRRFRLG